VLNSLEYVYGVNIQIHSGEICIWSEYPNSIHTSIGIHGWEQIIHITTVSNICQFPISAGNIVSGFEVPDTVLTI